MKGGKTPLKTKGYTIVEVMIVLAVSGMMFLMAATFINGKQQKTAFTQGSNELGSRMQEVVDDVINGHYSDVPLQCPIIAGAATASYDAGGTQGTNSQCVFLGKLVHFYASSSTDPLRNYEVIPLADSRTATDGTFPRGSIGAIQDLIVKKTIPQGLEVVSMTVRDASGAAQSPPAYSIGFIQGSGEVANTQTGEYKSGSQTVKLVYSATTQRDRPVDGVAAFGSNIRTAKSAEICITDGTRYAKMLIGGQNNTSQLSIKVQQLGETAC